MGESQSLLLLFAPLLCGSVRCVVLVPVFLCCVVVVSFGLGVVPRIIPRASLFAPSSLITGGMLACLLARRKMNGRRR